MAHYRKIDSRIQNDEKFCHLSDDGQLTFLLILTHPHLTALGAMRASVAGLAAEKRWPERRYRKAFNEAETLGMIKYDEQASFMWLPNFLKYNRPESPNVVRSWASSLELLPECSMKRDLCQQVKAFVKDLPKAFDEALAKEFDQEIDEVLPEDFEEDLSKTMPNQEQKQKQKQKQDLSGLEVSQDPSRAYTPAPETSGRTEGVLALAVVEHSEPVRQAWPASKKFPKDFPLKPPPWFLQWASEEEPDTDVEREWPKMLDYEYADPKTAFWACARNWMRNAPKFQRNGHKSPREDQALRFIDRLAAKDSTEERPT